MISHLIARLGLSPTFWVKFHWLLIWSRIGREYLTNKTVLQTISAKSEQERCFRKKESWANMTSSPLLKLALSAQKVQIIISKCEISIILLVIVIPQQKPQKGNI